MSLFILGINFICIQPSFTIIHYINISNLFTSTTNLTVVLKILVIGENITQLNIGGGSGGLLN